MSCTYTASSSILCRAPRTWIRRTPPSLAPGWWRLWPAEDCPLDVRVVLVEHWRAGIDGAHAQRGLSVLAYTYWVGCVDPVIDLHYDLDPVRHPEMPLHWHPPAMTVSRRPCGPATPKRAMQAALQLAADIERLQA